MSYTNSSRTRTTIIVVALIAIVAIVTFGSGKLGKKAASGEPIKIGVVYALTGPAATWTQYGKWADDLAVRDINAAGGVNGRPIELIYEDSKTAPATSVSAFQKLTSVDHVQAVIGDVWSFITNPLIPLADQKKVVLISPTVMDKSVEGKSDYFYTIGHTVGSQRDSVRKFLASNATAKTATILCWNDAWGQAHEQLFKEVMAERGVKLLGEECTNDFGSNYRTELAKLQALKPDVLFATPGTIAFYKTRHELGVTTPTLTTNIVIDGLENQNMPRELAQGLYFTEWTPNQAFVDSFKKMYGKTPIMEAQNHYEAVRALAKAMENNPDDVLAGLRTVKYEGIAGTIDFTGDHTQVNQENAKLYIVGESEYVEVK